MDLYFQSTWYIQLPCAFTGLVSKLQCGLSLLSYTGTVCVCIGYIFLFINVIVLLRNTIKYGVKCLW